MVDISPSGPDPEMASARLFDPTVFSGKSLECRPDAHNLLTRN
ncbi:hypothetical protein MMSP_0668 [Mycobacterium sp. 012931]|nr:hypothetical protein MMSP_0668 [Mycobacterium sp. 012931]